MSFPLKTTEPNTNDVTNIPLPIKLLIEKSIPSASAEATNDDMTSGAPLPNANNVTAATFWFMLNVSTIFVIAVLKKMSLVDDSTKNKNIKKRIIIIDVKIVEPFIKQ